MSFSNGMSRAVLAALFSKATGELFGGFGTPPANIFIGLSTADPTDDGSAIAEPSGNAYARVSTAPANWGDPTDANPSVISNSAIVTFPTATGSWGTVTHFFLSTAASGGTFIAGAALDVSKAVAEDDVVSFQIGEIDVTMT